MTGSTPIRLKAWLDETGTKPVWLAERVHVGRSTMCEWLAGTKPIGHQHQLAILRVLRERQLQKVGPELFYSEV